MPAAASAQKTNAANVAMCGEMSELVRDDEQRVGAEADEALMADRQQAGKAGQQVPALRHGEDEEDLGNLAQHPWA